MKGIHSTHDLIFRSMHICQMLRYTISVMKGMHSTHDLIFRSMHIYQMHRYTISVMKGIHSTPDLTCLSVCPDCMIDDSISLVLH
jgi:hypothetical protein